MQQDNIFCVPVRKYIQAEEGFVGRKWGGSERVEASVELWTQGALRHKKHSPYGTLRTPRCAQRTLNFVKAFIKLKRMDTLHYFPV